MLRLLASLDRVVLDRRRGRHARGTGAVRVVSGGLAGALLLGVTAVAATGAPAPARREAVRPAAVRLSAVAQPSPVAVPTTARPAPRATHRAPGRPPSRRTSKHAAPARPRPVVRWLPTGTGMWLHQWDRTQGGNAAAVVREADRSHLTTLYVRTGSSWDGFMGGPALSALLPVAGRSGIKVVAWDFPKLADPVGDARRMARAAAYRCKGCPRVAAVAPDVETAAEGTRIGDAAVKRYYSTLRALLPRDTAILATVPWPSEMRVGRYPYASTARWADAFMPMAYWYNRSPATVATTSVRYLTRFHKPVIPVGQGYDGRLDAPYLKADPHPGASVRAFLVAARRAGAHGVSLWSWQTTGGQQWQALRDGHRLFPTR
ncbi:MAG: hypothetical protein ACXVFU_16120 [Nocardioidaceae bacterium]